MDLVSAAEGFALLADVNRLRILRILSRGEQNATQLLQELPVSQPTLSHHMKLLCGGGLVQRRRQGQRIFYTLDLEMLEKLFSVIQSQPRKEQGDSAPPAVIVRSGHR